MQVAQAAAVGMAQQLSPVGMAQKLNKQKIQALFVDKMFWNGVLVHAGHYQNGLIITDVTGQQYVYENGVLVGLSNLWSFESINGVLYAKHSYPDGSCVYSTEFSQFVVVA